MHVDSAKGLRIFVSYSRRDMEGDNPVEAIGAGLAALGVIGPGIGIGILTGLAATAIGRNPDATPQIRAQFILGAAFAEGLGVLAIVVAILAIVLPLGQAQ